MIGAVGEFHRGPSRVQRLNEWTVGSDLGAIRVSIGPGIHLVAYEMLSADPESWHHGVAICLPVADAGVERVAVVTEIGRDSESLYAEHSEGVLFDLGLNSATCRFCVRVTDPAQMREIRLCKGQSVLDYSNRLFQRLQRWSPHRVLLSRAGRIEVYQKIGQHGGATPLGPHTHLIPDLLRSHIPHPSYLPVPQGHLPAMMFYPANPVRDAMGHSMSFASEEHATFQKILSAFGNRDYVRAKSNCETALKRGRQPPTAGTRIERLAMRIVSRQANAQVSA